MHVATLCPNNWKDRTGATVYHQHCDFSQGNSFKTFNKHIAHPAYFTVLNHHCTSSHTPQGFSMPLRKTSLPGRRLYPKPNTPLCIFISRLTLIYCSTRGHHFMSFLWIIDTSVTHENNFQFTQPRSAQGGCLSFFFSLSMTKRSQPARGGTAKEFRAVLGQRTGIGVHFP